MLVEPEKLITADQFVIVPGQGMTRVITKPAPEQKTRIPSAKTFNARTLSINKESKTLLKSRFSRQLSRDKVITYDNSNLIEEVFDKNSMRNSFVGGMSINDAFNRKLIQNGV